MKPKKDTRDTENRSFVIGKSRLENITSTSRSHLTGLFSKNQVQDEAPNAHCTRLDVVDTIFSDMQERVSMRGVCIRYEISNEAKKASVLWRIIHFHIKGLAVVMVSWQDGLKTFSRDAQPKSHDWHVTFRDLIFFHSDNIRESRVNLSIWFAAQFDIEEMLCTLWPC